MSRTRVLEANVTQMIPIPATVLNVDTQRGKYLITVRVQSGAYQAGQTFPLWRVLITQATIEVSTKHSQGGGRYSFTIL
jgi:hypothetical protein